MSDTSSVRPARPSPPPSSACRRAVASALEEVGSALRNLRHTPPAATAAAVRPGSLSAGVRARPSLVVKRVAALAASRLRAVTSRSARPAKAPAPALAPGCSPGGGVANSTRTPAVPFGWRKQIIPARPGRGASSITGRLAPRAAASSDATSGVSKQTWWRPSPRLARNLATPPPASIGSSSSISLRPIGSRAARTPWSRTVACLAMRSPSVSCQKARPSSRRRTTRPTWCTRVSIGTAGSDAVEPRQLRILRRQQLRQGHHHPALLPGGVVLHLAREHEDAAAVGHRLEDALGERHLLHGRAEDP